MNAQSTFKLPQTLRRAFDRYRRRRRFVGGSSGLLLSIAIVAGAVGAAAAADRLLRLPELLRTVLLVAILAAFAFCVIRWVIYRVVRRLRDREAAVRLGRRFPHMEEDMVSAVELSENGHNLQGVSPSLVRSALEKIEDRTGKVDHRAAVPARPVVEAAAVFMALALAIGAAYLLRPQAVENALLRLLRPGSGIPFFCYTGLAEVRYPAVIGTGDGAEVTARICGRQPDEAVLEAQNGGERLRVRLPCADERVRWMSGALFQDLRFRMQAGDATSPWHHIRVVPRPALSGKSALLRDPEYAGAESRTIESIQGPLEIIKGTGVSIRAAPVHRGEAPEFRCGGLLTFGDEQLSLAPDASGVLCSPLFEPSKSGEYLIGLTDGWGLASRAPDSVFIKVSPDGLPRVSITSPDRDVMALPNETVEVQAEAEDEFGLRGLELLYRTIKGDEEPAEGGEWQHRGLQEGGIKVRKLGAKTLLSLEELALVPRDTLEYRARASDYADQAALRSAFSRTYRIIVLSEMEHLELALARLRELQIELLRKAAAERYEAARSGELAEKAKDASVSEEARQAQQRQLELALETEALARKLEAMIAQLVRNPSAPISLAKDLEQIGRNVRSVAADQMTTMAKDLGQAARAEPGQQAECLKQAQDSGQEAAERLEQLAKLLERMQRQGLLEKLAADAELLAARQRELKEAMIPVARKTVGFPREALDEELDRAVGRLTAMQEWVKTGVDSLAKDIEKATDDLASSKPEDAETAEQAGRKLQTDKVSEKAAAIAKQIDKNILFSEVTPQESVAQSLTEVADVLRRKSDQDSTDAFARQLDEFIVRQQAINRNIHGAIHRVAAAKTPMALGQNQSTLERDVSEQASALHWLQQELENFRSDSVDKLSSAAGEMKAGAEDLYRSSLPQGREHGEKALELLQSARQKFQADRQQMGQAGQGAQSMEAMLLLQRILLGQQQINRQTSAADKMRSKDAEGFDRKVVGLAKRQSQVRLDAGRLQQMLGRFPRAARRVGEAGEKMDVSRIALEAADTGQDTRVVQREILALLESLIGDPSGMGGAGEGLAWMRTMAMMQLMQNMGSGGGSSPGGSLAGGNAPILPTSVDEAANEDWRLVRSRFEGKLGEGFESQYPAEFRDLLNSYFDRLRAEPPR